MLRIAVILLADTQSAGDMGRMANALSAVQEFKEAGDEIQLVFDGAGVRWPVTLSDPQHKYHQSFEAIRDKVSGVCNYCAKVYGVAEAIEQSDLPFSNEFRGHPSFRQLIQEGYQVITF